MNVAIIIGIIVLFAIITEFAIIKAFSYGVKVGKSKDITPEPFKKPSKPKKKVEMTDEMSRIQDVWHNIEVYDGTSIGQKEIKRG